MGECCCQTVGVRVPPSYGLWNKSGPQLWSPALVPSSVAGAVGVSSSNWLSSCSVGRRDPAAPLWRGSGKLLHQAAMQPAGALRWVPPWSFLQSGDSPQAVEEAEPLLWGCWCHVPRCCCLPPPPSHPWRRVLPPATSCNPPSPQSFVGWRWPGTRTPASPQSLRDASVPTVPEGRQHPHGPWVSSWARGDGNIISWCRVKHQHRPFHKRNPAAAANPTRWWRRPWFLKHTII